VRLPSHDEQRGGDASPGGECEATDYATSASGREIGPIGAISRVLAGAAAITLPVALEGIGWWDVPALVAATLVATAAARLIAFLFERIPPEVPASRHAICSPAGCALSGVLFTRFDAAEARHRASSSSGQPPRAATSSRR
jgi:hypothetical protein